MTMWKLRGCPRCQGDLFVNKDMDGWFEQCLQCGHRREMRPIVEGQKPQPNLVTERVPSSGVETPEKRRPGRGTSPERIN